MAAETTQNSPLKPPVVSVLPSASSYPNSLASKTDNSLWYSDGTTWKKVDIGTVALAQGGTGADLSGIAKGGIIAGTGSGAVSTLGVGSDGQVLTAASGQTTGLQWATPAGAVSGQIAPFGMSVPSGWLACDGSAVSRTTYAALFSAIGTSWGSGDGSTTFNLPDLRGRTPIGSGTGSGLTARTLGQTGGSESVTLTAAQSGLPSHTHTFGIYGTTGGANSTLPQEAPAGATFIGSATTNATGGTDAGSSHTNMQPFAVVTYGIKT